MNREEIRDHVRELADELTEAPEGLFTDVQLDKFINRSIEKVQLDFLEFMPWYFRKEVAISLIINQREYNISSDLGIDGNIVITVANQQLDFDEGAGPFLATITPNTYTPATLCTEIDTKMTAAGGAAYAITYSGKVFRISNDSTLNLNAATGPNIANGIWSTIGFAATDLTGFINYAGDQYIDVQNFLMFESIMNRQAGSQNRPLLYLDPKDLFLHETVGATGTPANVRYWGYKDVDEIFFVPTPNANGASQLLGYYFRKIADLNSNTDVPELPRLSHELVSLDVLRKWYIRDGDKSAASIEGRFNTMLTNLQFRLGNPQGPRPGKRPGTPEIAKMTS